MFPIRLFISTLLLSSVVVALPVACTAAPKAVSTSPTKTILEMKEGAEKRLKPSSDQISVKRSDDPAAPGLLVTIQPGKDEYPGLTLTPEGGPWDLSAFGHVEARVTNTGTQNLSFALRLDNAGNWQDNPWNGEVIYLKPGESGIISTIFGHSWGHKPAYPLKPNAITSLLMYAGKSDAVQSFRIESLMAAGPAGEKPPVDPASVREKPVGGFLLGGATSVDATGQVSSQGAQASLVGSPQKQALQVVFPASTNEQSASLKPLMGRWDLGDSLEVHVKVRNTGTAPLTPRARLQTDGGSTEWASTAAPLAPNAVADITIPFVGSTVADVDKPTTGSQIASQVASAVDISVAPTNGEQKLLVESIQAVMPPAPNLPDWLGKRPPVAGDWVKTLDDEFDGNTLDTSVWSMYGANYWDKASHWSKDDVIMGNGKVRLRYEKKTGFNNDDPTQNSSPYAAGYLHTYDKWTQRYGYFEARMKFPKTPGLWPAFWMMPDRGNRADPQWKRQDTKDGGMEFDIVEHLSIWGPNRYSAGMHYDGYDKDHKSVGSSKLYVQPDKDGYITGGLLWTPGSAVFYGNGREIARWDNPRISDVASILMFTLPSGGWDGNTLDETKLPDELVVDYVRVWQRKDLASPGDGKKSAPADGKPVATP